MRTKKICFTAIFMICSLLISCSPASNNAKINILSVYEDARAEAKKSQRKIEESQNELEKIHGTWRDAALNWNSYDVALPEVIIDCIIEQGILIDSLGCFYFAEEITPGDMVDFLDSFCWMYYDWGEEDDDYEEAREIYSLKYAEQDSIIVLDNSTIGKLAKDFLGLDNYVLDYDDPDVAEYVESLLRQQEIYADYILDRESFCYIPHDPDPPLLSYKSSHFLGDDMYYVIFEQVWTGADPVQCEDLHIIIRCNDSYFGYEIVSILQDDVSSLIK